MQEIVAVIHETFDYEEPTILKYFTTQDKARAFVEDKLRDPNITYRSELLEPILGTRMARPLSIEYIIGHRKYTKYAYEFHKITVH
jgi:hypothetical protein